MMSKDDIHRHIAAHTGFDASSFKGGNVRHDGDFDRVHLIMTNNGQHLIAHKQSLSDEVVLEVHDEYGPDGRQLENMVTLSYSLTPGQRYDLGMYLLQNINVLV